jgi:hypothetical protein
MKPPRRALARIQPEPLGRQRVWLVPLLSCFGAAAGAATVVLALLGRGCL